MKTEQEQIKAIKQIIDERVETTLGQVQGRHGNVIKTVDTVIIARDIVDAGYGDISEYKAEREMLGSQIKVLKQRLNDKYVEVDNLNRDYRNAFERLKAQESEIERLRTTLGQCNTELNSALESLKSQCREIGELKAKIKQAQIDVLKRLKVFSEPYPNSWGIYVIDVYHIDELIKEVENDK